MTLSMLVRVSRLREGGDHPASRKQLGLDHESSGPGPLAFGPCTTLPLPAGRTL